MTTPGNYCLCAWRHRRAGDFIEVRSLATEAAKLARGPLSQAIREIDAIRGTERMKLERTLELSRQAHTDLVKIASGKD